MLYFREFICSKEVELQLSCEFLFAFFFVSQILFYNLSQLQFIYYSNCSNFMVFRLKIISIIYPVYFFCQGILQNSLGRPFSPSLLQPPLRHVPFVHFMENYAQPTIVREYFRMVTQFF